MDILDLPTLTDRQKRDLYHAQDALLCMRLRKRAYDRSGLDSSAFELSIKFYESKIKQITEMPVRHSNVVG